MYCRIFLVLFCLPALSCMLGCEKLKSTDPLLAQSEYEILLVGDLEADYIGTENCLSACHAHDELKKHFDASTMGAQMRKDSGMPLVDCETCHGPGSLAIEGITRELVEEFHSFRFNNYRGNASSYVVDTLQTVFHYLFSTSSFEECLVGVVNQGGDADTTGAIAGMIAGAFYGLDAIPARWLKKLNKDVRAEVEDQAVRLVKLSPWGEKMGEG